MRRLDHIVLCVNDLGLARARYAALGFTCTPVAHHPFGTSNSLVQLGDRSFLELLAVRDPAAVPPHELPHRFSLAAYIRDFLGRCGEGASMLVLRSDDARADVARFRAAGLETYEPFDFGRDAVQPDGSTARVGFSLAFVTHPEMPDLVFFTCQHRHPPERFWKPEYQAHINGAAEVAEVTIGAADPEVVEGVLARLAGATLTPTFSLRERGKQAPSPRIESVRLTVPGLERTRACLEAGGIGFRAAPGLLTVPPTLACGLGLAFSEREAGEAQAAAG